MKGKKKSFQRSLQKCTPGLLHSFSKKEYYQRAQKKILILLQSFSILLRFHFHHIKEEDKNKQASVIHSRGRKLSHQGSILKKLERIQVKPSDRVWN